MPTTSTTTFTDDVLRKQAANLVKAMFAKAKFNSKRPPKAASGMSMHVPSAGHASIPIKF